MFFNGDVTLPLPTRMSGEALWGKVAGVDAWRRKFDSAIDRLSLELDDPPRALSEEHMYVDRGVFRRLYILAGPHGGERPRYDLQPIGGGGGPFYVHHDRAIEALQTDGGVILWYGTALEALGEPAAKWVNPNGRGVFVYVALKE